MVSEQEALVPVLLAEVREILFARIACNTIRAEGGELVAHHNGRVGRVNVPHIDNLMLQARSLADKLEAELTPLTRAV